MIRRVIGMGTMLTLVWILAGEGQVQAIEKSPAISVDVTEAYMEDVLKLLSKQSGLNFVASEDIRDKKVTLYLDHVPVRVAVETILQANHLLLKPTEESNLYVVTASDPKSAMTTRVFQLKYARVVPSAGEILPIFGLSGSLIAPTLGSATSGVSGTSTGVGGVGTGGIYGGGGGASGFLGVGGILGAGGTTGTTGTTIGIVHVVRSLLTEHGSAIPDARTNCLIVTDIPERMGMVEETIARLDVKPPQIFIEAEVLEVTLDTLRRLGIDYGDSAGQFGSYTGPEHASFFPLPRSLLKGASTTSGNKLGTLKLDDAGILFKLLATEKDVKFLARPRLRTLSNEVAEIRIVADAVTGVTSTSQSQTGTVTDVVERNTVGTILRVTPLVNEDKYITMVIEPEVSRVIQSASFSKFLDPNRRAARTTVMVPDGGTVMIAGLISTEDTKAARRIPGLGDIPILGLPFKRTETERKNTEIILFITPHILREQDSSSVLTQEREQTPLSTEEQDILEGYQRRILKERAIRETVENIFLR